MEKEFLGPHSIPDTGLGLSSCDGVSAASHSSLQVVIGRNSALWNRESYGAGSNLLIPDTLHTTCLE